MRPVYVIKDWDLLYETYESRRLTRACAWVAMPNKHDGKGFRRLMREPDGVAVYGAWAVAVQVASKCPIRGVLADLDGPLDALDLEDKTGVPASCFDRTFQLVTSDRIGWAVQISTPADVAALLAEVAARRSAVSRKPAGATAHLPKSAGVPADSPPPADTPADSPISAVISASSQEGAGDNAPRGRALADRTGPDRTIPYRTNSGVDEVACAALSETASFCLAIFGKKRHRLAYESESHLSRWAADLPLSDEQKHLIARFMSAPHDDRDFDLRSRPGSADTLAKNLFGVLERAEKYFSKNSPAEKNTVPGIDLEKFRGWFRERYPDKPLPASLDVVPDYILADFRKEEAA